ncbi:MAG: DUF4199 domain-containing protein [Solitalea-like symbiont of Tyrophagus putrescentiae]
MRSIYFKVTITFGCLIGLINIILAQGLKYMKIDIFSYINYIAYIPVLLLLYFAIKTYNKKVKHPISLKNAISVSLLTNIISSLIISIFSYLYFNIYTNELNSIKEQSYKEYIKRSDKASNKTANIPDNEDFEEYINTQYEPYKLALSNFTLGVFLSMVLSLIISVFYKIINRKLNAQYN